MLWWNLDRMVNWAPDDGKSGGDRDDNTGDVPRSSELERRLQSVSDPIINSMHNRTSRIELSDSLCAVGGFFRFPFTVVQAGVKWTRFRVHRFELSPNVGQVGRIAVLLDVLVARRKLTRLFA